MKFLMFNLVVGVALVFLFVGGSGDPEPTEQKTEDVFQSLKGKAETALSEAEISFGKHQNDNNTEAPSIKPKPQKIASVTPPTLAASALQATSDPRLQEKVREQQPVLAPDILKRREEILKPGSDAQIIGAFTPKIQEDRQEQLRSLAEEMELFAAQMSHR